jgi:hypothetical protein
MRGSPNMSRSDIAAPYCDWTEDKEAARHPVLMARRVMGWSIVCSIITLGILVLFQMLFPSMPDCDVIQKAVLICLVIGIVVCLFLNRSVLLNCTNCGEVMKTIHVDPTEGTPSDLEGQHGRIYSATGPGDNRGYWMRQMQELQVCEACKRYVVIQGAAYIVIGHSKEDVQEYEDRFNTARLAVDGKKFRRKPSSR